MSEATYDFDFRPDYWEPAADPITELTRNVKGQLRRELITEVVSGRAGDSEVHPDLLPDELNDPNLLGRLHPRFMGGEYLPGHLHGEVEIARIVLESTTMDVTSVRARPADGRIHYRVVDEYPDIGPFAVLHGPTISARPLRFGELVRLIDNIQAEPRRLGRGHEPELRRVHSRPERVCQRRPRSDGPIRDGRVVALPAASGVIREARPTVAAQEEGGNRRPRSREVIMIRRFLRWRERRRRIRFKKRET